MKRRYVSRAVHLLTVIGMCGLLVLSPVGAAVAAPVGADSSVASSPQGESTIGDFVWHDSNVNGLQDDNNQTSGINGVVVNLYVDDGDGIFDPGPTGDQLDGSQSTQNNQDAFPPQPPGWYKFNATPDVTYWVEIDPSNFDPGGALENYVYTNLPNTPPNYSGPEPREVVMPFQITDYVDADFGYALATLDLVKVAGTAPDGTNEYVPAPGATVPYTYTVTNTGETYIADIVVTDDNGTPAIPGDDFEVCTIAGPLAPTASQSCFWSGPVNADRTNVATALADATRSDGTVLQADAVSDTDDAVVIISSIEVSKTADPTSLPEPGGTVTFTVRVNNTSSAGSVTLTTLTDTIHGNLNGQGNCSVPQTIPAGGFYECQFTATVTGNAGDSETDTVTASGTDAGGNPLSDNDNATVTLTDVPSSIQVIKTANPISVPEPGGTVTFTVRVNNTSAVDSVTITTITDTIHGDLNGQGDCSVPQTIPAGGFYECSFTATISGAAGYTETDVVTASGTDDDGNPVSDSDDATVTVTGVGSSILVTKTADPISLPEPGGTVTFTVRIDNTSAVDSLTIDTLTDSIHGNLDGQGTCVMTQTIPVGGFYECAFTASVNGDPGYTETDVVTASGVDDDGDPVSDNDDATVTITDVPSSIVVTKIANPVSVPEPGGSVNFTVHISNTSAVDSVTIDSLTDTIHGDLNGQGNCSVPRTITVGGFYECTFTASVNGDPGYTETDVVTASGTDDDGDPVSDNDDATVTVTDVPSSIQVIKTAAPTTVPEPGDTVNFTVRINNTSAVDSVTITTLTDTIHGNLDGQGTCSVPQTIPAGGFYPCSFSAAVNGNAGDTETDVVTASGADDDGNPVSDNDDATVTLTNVPSSIVVTKTANPITVPEPGGSVNFIVRVDNTSLADSITIDTLTDSIHGDLDGRGSCSVPQTIPVGDSYQCSFSATVNGTPGYTETDVVTASGTDDDGDPVSDDDDATVTVTDVPSSIQVIKTADPTTVTEPGGTVNFTVRINNTSAVDSVTINTLNDSIHGDLNGQGNCSVPQTIAVGGFYECTFSAAVNGSAGYHETDVATASGTDDDGNPVSGSDDATVTVTSAGSIIVVTKTASPTSVPEPGGNVDFTVRIDNTSVSASITINNLIDSIHGDLNSQGTCSVPRTIPAGNFYECTFNAAVNGNAGYVETDTVTASGTDEFGGPVSGSDSATVTVTNVPSSIQVIKTAVPTGVSEPGGSVNFTVRVNNTSVVDTVTINSLTDSIHGNLNGQGSCSVPQTIPAGGFYECSFSATVNGNAGYTETDVATATGTDDDGDPVSDDDDATVTITNVPSSILVTKTANPTSVPEPGGTVNFTVRVDNTSAADSITINSLTDSIHGDLDGQGNCSVPQTIPVGGFYECSFSANVNGTPGYTETDVVTATGTDDDGNPVSDDDDATVTVTDVPSSIQVIKTANPTTVTEPGGTVTFTVRINNTSLVDTVTITSLIDSIHGNLSGQGSSPVPWVIPAGGFVEFTFSAAVNGLGGYTETDVVTASGTDDDGNSVSGSDDATVTVVTAGSSILVTKTASPTSVPEPGGSVSFTVRVDNTSLSASVTITSLIDSIHGNLNGQGSCAVPQTLAAGSFYQCTFNASVSGNAGDIETDTVTASGTDELGNPVSGNDSATVTITDVPSSIQVIKTAVPTTIPEPGGTVNFTVRVNNTSLVDSVTINSLTDTIHGNLDGQGTCSVPQTIPAGGFYECTFTAFVSGNANDTETDTVIASGTDDDGNPVSDLDDATVTLEDVASSIQVIKTPNPSTITAPGGDVTFTVRINNTSPADTVVITSMIDSIYGNLDGQGTCSVPQTIPAGGFYECTFTVTVTGEGGDVETDIITVVGYDDDGVPGNTVSDDDDAEVTIVEGEPVPGCIVGYKVDDLHVGLPDWVIRTSPSDTGFPVYETTTDGTGYFAFPDLTPGRYLVWEVLQEGWTPVTSQIFEVTVPEGPGCVQVRFKNRQATPTPTPIPTWTPTPTPSCDCDADAFEPDDQLSAAKPLPMDGTNQTHTFHDSADVDWFRMGNLEAGTEYNVRTSNLAPGTDTYMSLYDSNGLLVTSNDDIDILLCLTDPQYCASTITWVAANNGPYYLSVRTLTYPASQYPVCYCPGYNIRGRTPVSYLPVIVVPDLEPQPRTPTPTVRPPGLMHPKGVAVNPSAHRAYITSRDNDRLYMIDTLSLATVKSVKTGDEPWGVGYDPNTNRVYVSNFRSSDVYVYNASTLDLITVIPTGGNPTFVALDPARNHIAVVNRDINGVMIINGNTESVQYIKGSGGTGPWGLAFNTNLNRLYVSNRDAGGVATLDGTQGFKLLSSQTVQPCGDRSSPYHVAFNPLNNKLYVSCAPAGYVNRAVVYRATASGLVLLASLPTGDGGRDGGGGIAINPATGNAFFTNSVDNTVTIISGATDSVIGTVPVGLNPFGAAADPVTRQVFVVNRDSNNFSVIPD